MKKPELLIAAGSLDDVKAYIEAGADAVVMGESRFGLRLPGDCKPEEIAEAVQLAHGRGASVYVAVNNLMDNEAVELLPDYLIRLAAAQVDAILFGDPAVLRIARTAAPELKLHWNAEMTSTNYATADYWGRRGASRFVLARELNMDQVIEMKKNSSLEVQVQVHGMTNIYHSKRPLVGNYIDHQTNLYAGEKPFPLEGRTIGEREDGLYLIEVERPDERYPIYEDANGTHIMSSDDICILESLHELMEAGIDSFSIEPLLKSRAYNEAVIRAYRHAVDLYAQDPEAYRFEESWLEPIRELQHPDRELSFGFFYKEQVY